MPDLVPIRVKIKRGVVGGRIQHVYPNFNTLDPNVRGNMDWSLFFDMHGIGWHYDKCCGFGETDTYNTDPDMWYGGTCVPESFASAAIAAFPNEVEELSESDWTTYYDTRAHVHDQEEVYDLNTLQAIKAKKQLGRSTNKSDDDALDPDKPNSGIIKNHNKTWQLFKTKRNITVISSSSSTSSGP